MDFGSNSRIREFVVRSGLLVVLLILLLITNKLHCIWSLYVEFQQTAAFSLFIYFPCCAYMQRREDGSE